MYRVLGELEVGEDDQLLDLPVGPALMVLAALIVNANHRVAKSALLRVGWGGAGEVGEPQLPKRVGQVRELLGQLGRRDDLRTHPGFGYELRVPVDDVDALKFQRLVRQADEAAASNRSDAEIGHLRQALRLWRGPHPLSNLPGHAFQHEVAALEKRRKRAAVRLFELEFASGNHAGTLDELILAASSYPTDQRLCELLMITEYRAGHVADVAEAYERYRTALDEETGKGPDPLLRDLHFAIARDDGEAIAAAEAALAKRGGTPRPRPVAAVPAQLPRPAELVGRDHLVAEVTWLLGRETGPAVPVIVISGPGGIGKTALALRAAHESRERFPDGQLYVDLRDGSGTAIDPSEVAAQFLRTLGAPRVPEAKAERLADFRSMLAGRRVLVMLDDAVDGAQVAELAPASPGCAVLVTARQRLPEIASAHHVAPLAPLRHADAADLFLRVVRDAGVAIDDDPAAVERVLSLCGGLPLALRIAGALRAHGHPRPTAELADRLARQGLRALSYGQLSVDRTIGAGFERLDPAARKLFLGLGLLPLTSFGLWTAAALLDTTQTTGADATGAAGDGAEAMSELAASFMIESVESEMRYRFHDLTRDYACRRALSEYPDDPELVPAIAYRALLTLARRAHACLYGGDFEVVHSGVPDWAAPPGVLADVEAAPLDWFEKERLNIRAAVTHCADLGLTGECWDLAVSAHEFYTIRGYFDDWLATHTVALDACRRAGDKRGEGIVLACLNQPALVASRRTDSGTAMAELEQAASLLAEAREVHGQAITLRTLAHALRRQGHLTKPLALLNDVLAHYTASGDQVGRWQTLRFIGQTHLDLGDYDAARDTLDAALAIAAGLGRRRLIAQTQYWIGQTRLATGDLDGARAAFDVVLDAFSEDSGLGLAYARHGLGDVALRTGDYATAEQHLAMAASVARDQDDAVLEGRVWLSIAALRRVQGHLDQQEIALGVAAEVFAGCGAARLEMRALASLARARSQRNDSAAADAAWTRIEALYAAADLPDSDRLYRRCDR